MQGEIWRRNMQLVRHLTLEVLEEEPVALPVLVRSCEEFLDDGGLPRWSVKTVENTVRDLVAFGVFRVVSRGRDRLVSVTVLGRAWLDGVVLPGLEEGPSVLAGAVFEMVERGDA